MKPILCLLLLLSAASGYGQTTFTITLTAEQVAALDIAVEAANLAAQDAYTKRTNEVAALLAAGDRFATNPPPPIVLTRETYVQGFANQTLTTTQRRVESDIATELKNRIDGLSYDDLKALRRTLPRRRQ